MVLLLCGELQSKILKRRASSIFQKNFQIVGENEPLNMRFKHPTCASSVENFKKRMMHYVLHPLQFHETFMQHQTNFETNFFLKKV